MQHSLLNACQSNKMMGNDSKNNERVKSYFLIITLFIILLIGTQAFEAGLEYQIKRYAIDNGAPTMQMLSTTVYEPTPRLRTYIKYNPDVHITFAGGIGLDIDIDPLISHSRTGDWPREDWELVTEDLREFTSTFTHPYIVGFLIGFLIASIQVWRKK